MPVDSECEGICMQRKCFWLKVWESNTNSEKVVGIHLLLYNATTQPPRQMTSNAWW